MNEDNLRIDMNFIQSNFPGLNRGWTLMDNAGGSQTSQSAIDCVVEYLAERNVQIGGSYEISLAAADAVMQGRRAAQILMNAHRPEEIVFGPSTTQLLRTLANSMRSQFLPGDEVIVSIADHESNIGPWEMLREFGIVIKFWPVHAESYSLRLEDLAPLMTERTRLVCVHHVSNVFGQINPIAEFTRFIHAHGAKICVDAVAYAPHRAIDVQAWDVDYYVFSLYKCYGPHIAILYGKYDLLLELDSQYHYFYGKDKVPGKLEPGNPCYELAYSTVGVLDYMCRLAKHHGATGSSRDLVEAAFRVMTQQEDILVNQLLTYLNGRNDCKVIGATKNVDSARVPTIAFKFDNMNAGDIVRNMDNKGIAIRFGDFHSRRLIEMLDESDHDGVLRVSMVHYNTVAEVDSLCAALAEFSIVQ